MIAVIFEVVIARGRQRDYLGLAEQLKSRLAEVDGFISIERFQSLVDADKLLSLSFWRDEASITRWRDDEAHRAAQGAGRGGIFADYRLRVARVSRDYGMHDREQSPPGSVDGG